LHFADIAGAVTHTYDPCEFEVSEGSVIERSLQSGFGRFWRGDECQQTTEVLPPQPPDIELGEDRCRSCEPKGVSCEYSLKFQCNDEYRGGDDCTMPVACDRACCEWAESIEVALGAGPWKRVIHRSRNAGAPEASLVYWTYTEVRVVFPEDEDPVSIFTSPPDGELRWRDRGRRMIFNGSDTVVGVELATGTVTRSASTEPEPVRPEAVATLSATNGRRGQVIVDERGRQWVEATSSAEPGAAPTQTTANHPDLRNPTWHPAGDWLVYWRRAENGMWRLTIGTADGATFSDLRVKAGRPGPIAVSQDGLYVAFVRENIGLRIAALATPGEPFRTLDPRSVKGVAWAPRQSVEPLRQLAAKGRISLRTE
jgi:hypothetical protein